MRCTCQTAVPSGAPWSRSTTRPGWRSSRSAWPPPGSRSSPPARPPRASPTPASPVTKVEELTGFPECLDGRVKTLHPKVHAGHPGRPAARVAPRAARRARHRAVRPGGLQPLPVHRDGGLRRDARRVHRADRHRRPVDGAGRGEEPPERRDRDLARRSTTTCSRRCRTGGFTLAQRQRLAAAAFAHTAAYDVASRPGWATC